MAKILGLPKLSPTMDEGTLVRWVKKEGDAIEVDDLLAEVETDKATMEFRSFDRGTLLKILVPEGETLAPDTPVAIVGKEGEDVSGLLGDVKRGGEEKSDRGAAAADLRAPRDEGNAAREEQTADAARDVATKGSVDERSSDDAREADARSDDEDSSATDPDASESDERRAGARAVRPTGTGAAASKAGQAAQESARSLSGERVLASPLVRKLGREHGIDLRSVKGSGPGGRIVKRDVDAALESVAGAPPTSAASAPADSRIEKASQMRKTIARRLTESKRDVPHYYLTQDVDAAALVALRKELNASLEASGEKVSVNDLLVKLVAVALRTKPTVNVSWHEGEIHRHTRVDVAVAVSVPDGLMTPVVRGADRKGVLDIAREIRELAGRAKEKRLKPEEYSGSTFSISNLGMYGIESFTAVINPPEAAILALGAVREEPVIRGGAIVPGTRLRMTLSCDHRVVDGAVGAEWLAHLRGYIERPLSLLL